MTRVKENMHQNEHPVLACNKLVKEYRQGPDSIRVLNGINCKIASGETVSIVGASGSGKSTLLNLLGGLDLPTEGEILLNGQCLNQLNEKERGLLRNKFMGFVYQFHHLLPEFSAIENVMMPLLIAKTSLSEAKGKSHAMLESVGLSHRASHKPAELSGGERQRVAIARALVAEPSCVFMDEPTGNLDTRTARSVQDLMADLNQQFNTSFVIVTHDEQLAATMDRTLYLADGKLTDSTGSIGE